ncbi:phage antirepressor KilAC domain-containing protein [Nocardioides sp. GY 10127]|uniref:phage antirepressor n=1 Tax=Nocardioides sp. GY 10127 TaxID=2569762 RepID=UPI001F0D72F6|nr:phage antirepressor KilAC domain-containing protein [Nocardioides sp. GY 10127]
MLEVFTYADVQIRTALIDGEPWFVLADVAAVLGIKEVSRLASRLPGGVRQAHPIVDSLGRTQQATVVSEAGLYRVVLRSDAPSAEPFIGWVTDDVLPTIRRTGRYGSDVDMLTSLPSSRVLALAAEAAKKAEDAEARALAAEETAAQLEAPAARWLDIAGAAGDYAVDHAAKVLASRAGVDVGRNRLFKKMADLGWIYRQPDGWHAYQTAIGSGLLAERINQPRVLEDGRHRAVAPTIRITGKGIDRLVTEYLPQTTLAVNP